MATAKIFPKASQVTGTHSNMPLVLIPSEILDIGTLTLAEAQSVRIYTDSSLVTEVAREVVAADEIYFKAPSASSAMEFWVDWDGVRADYSVSATYGRNAVWTEFLAVYHFQDTGWVDSTGNGYNLTAGPSSPTIVTGRVGGGNAADFVKASNQHLQRTGLPFSGARSFQMWTQPDAIRDDGALVSQGNLGGLPWVRSLANRAVIGEWKLRVGVYNGTSIKAYSNGVSGATDVYSSSGGASDYGISMRDHSSVGMITDINSETASTFVFGGRATNVNSNNYDGRLDEARMMNKEINDDWIETDYNNQSDNAAFWDSDPAGGGPTANNSARRMLLMQM